MEILLSNKQRFLVDSLFTYNSLYKNRLELANRYKLAAKSSDKLRANTLQDLSDAIFKNCSLFEEVMQSIKSSCTVDDLMVHGFYQSRTSNVGNDLIGYLKDLKYLRRDWCGHQQGELEINMIVHPLKKQIEKYCVDTDSILFLGAGLGRIAWEHTDLFKKVNALDKSYSMVYFFHKLLKEDITFYELHEANVYKSKHAVRKHVASIQNSSESGLKYQDRFSYIVGDVLELPYEKDSQSAIASIYFTDVIALKLFIKEIIRVLKIGGLFVHFGPLSYFFSDLKERLTAEEIMEVFLSFGFEILHDELIEVPFMPATNDFYKTIQTNWFLIAKKRDTSADKYMINLNVKTRRTKKLDDVQESEELLLVGPDGKVFEHAEGVIEMLKYFKDKKSMDEVLLQIFNDYPDQSKESILNILEILITEKLIINIYHDN